MHRIYNSILDVVSVEFGIGRAVLESQRHGPSQVYTRIRRALYSFLIDEVGMNSSDIRRVAGGGPSFAANIRRLSIQGRKARVAGDDDVVNRCYHLMNGVYSNYRRLAEMGGIECNWSE